MSLNDRELDCLTETVRLYRAAREEFDELLSRGLARREDFAAFFAAFKMVLTE